MPQTATETAGFPAIEHELAEAVPFGSHAHISAGLASVYGGLLGAISGASPAAASLRDTVQSADQMTRRALFRDPLLRRTLEDGVCAILYGIDTIDRETLDALLTSAGNAVAAGNPLLGATTPLCGPADGLVQAWTAERPETAAERRLAEEVARRLPGLTMAAATPEQVAALKAGCRIAGSIVPRLSRSALSHAFLVVIGVLGDGAQRFNSATIPGLPGIVFLSPDVVTSGAVVAEALLHEALHLKFLDIDYVSPLFALGFRQESSPRVTPVWHLNNPGYGNWPVDRLLTSMHVYASLAVYFDAASSTDAGRELYPQAAGRAAQCRSRAAWLSTTAQGYLDHLSEPGRDFVAWIGAMLDRLGSSRLSAAS
jgi:hypothetical protein